MESGCICEGWPSSQSQAQQPLSSSLRPSPCETLTHSRSETAGRVRHRQAGRQIRQTRLAHTHTGWPLPLAWFTLALGIGSEGSGVGPELWDAL